MSGGLRASMLGIVVDLCLKSQERSMWIIGAYNGASADIETMDMWLRGQPYHLRHLRSRNRIDFPGIHYRMSILG